MFYKFVVLDFMIIDHLKKRIEKYKNAHLVPQEKRVSYYKITASVICMEIVSAVITGILIGHMLDLFLNTRYIFKVVCLLFAFVACFVVLYKLVKD